MMEFDIAYVRMPTSEFVIVTFVTRTREHWAMMSSPTGAPSMTAEAQLW